MLAQIHAIEQMLKRIRELDAIKDRSIEEIGLLVYLKCQIKREKIVVR